MSRGSLGCTPWGPLPSSRGRQDSRPVSLRRRWFGQEASAVRKRRWGSEDREAVVRFWERESEHTTAPFVQLKGRPMSQHTTRLGTWGKAHVRFPLRGLGVRHIWSRLPTIVGAQWGQRGLLGVPSKVLLGFLVLQPSCHPCDVVSTAQAHRVH